MAKKTEVSLEGILSKYGAEMPLEFVTSGSLAVDAVLGGGIARGAMYGFWGSRGSGKSTVAIQCVKQFCKQGEKCAMIDVEKAFNQQQQEAFGVRQYVEDGTLLYLTADNYAQVDEICTAISKSDVKLVVIDSETALLVAMPEDIDVTSERPGQKARQAAVTLQKVKTSFYKAGIASIWVFHARANISMTANPYAPADKMAGGYAAGHVPDALLKISAGQKVGDKGTPEGQIIHLECEKNKFCKPFQKVDTELTFGKGISKKKEVMFFALEQGVIEQKGSFFNLPDGSTVRGRDALYELSNDQMRMIKEALKPII